MVITRRAEGRESAEQWKIKRGTEKAHDDGKKAEERQRQ